MLDESFLDSVGLGGLMADQKMRSWLTFKKSWRSRSGEKCAMH